jgi:hypothetical protein
MLPVQSVNDVPGYTNPDAGETPALQPFLGGEIRAITIKALHVAAIRGALSMCSFPPTKDSTP